VLAVLDPTVAQVDFEAVVEEAPNAGGVDWLVPAPELSVVSIICRAL